MSAQRLCVFLEKIDIRYYKNDIILRSNDFIMRTNCVLFFNLTMYLLIIFFELKRGVALM